MMGFVIESTQQIELIFFHLIKGLKYFTDASDTKSLTYNILKVNLSSNV